MISKRSLLLMIYLAITGCTMDCVEPGLQSRNTSINIDIPVHKDDEGIKIHWVDSDQVISQGEKIEFSLSGSVDFCPSKERKNPVEVPVPAVFCADGSIPSYSSELIDNSGLNEQEVCGNVGFGDSQSYSKKRYVDTGIKVNPGDKLSFSLIPRKIKIDYINPKGKGISFDDNCYKTEKGDEKDKATITDMLNGGTFYCENNGKRTAVKFPQLSKEKMETGEVLVGNGYTPYDNKVHFNKDYIPWIHGSLLDLRRAKIGLNELLDRKQYDPDKAKKYSSYELNCYSQNICYNPKGIWSRHSNCVSSIRYKKYDKGNACDMYSHLEEVANKLKKIEENKGDYMQINIDPISNTEKDTEDVSWAEALVAKIGGSGYTNGGAKGDQCLPNEKGAGENNIQGYDYARKCSKTNDNFEDFSLRLDHDYEVSKDVKSGSDVMLAIASNGNYHLHRGGYHVKVTRSCEYANGEKLYVYLGDEPPKDFHGVGTDDFKAVGVKNEGKYTILDVISGKHFQKGESKKIYFGIDVSNVKKDEIINKEGKYYENSKYRVTLFIKRKINDFISSNINGIFSFIKEIFKGNVESLYKGYIKGLLQGVRALLTLYVIFTVVGYMLGTIQLGKFDFIVRMMKIAFIAFAFSDRSWELFGTVLSTLFVDGSTYLVDSFSGYIEEGGRKFAFLDLTTGVLFTGETWLKFLSLMLSGPFGFIAFLIILYASFTFLGCIISATFKYVISTVLVAFLLSLTPLFVVFILFQQTKSLFDNWIKTLAHVALQPVILFSSLSLLNQLMYSVLYNLTNFSACYQCLISVNFLSHDLCLMKSILPLGYSPGTSVDVALGNGEKAGGHFAALPIDIIQAFIYLIIAGAMEAFVRISETMAQAILSSGWGVAGGVSKVAQNASQSILSTFGLDNTTQGMIQNIRQQVSKDRLGVEAKSKQSEPHSQESDKTKSNDSDKPKPDISEQLRKSSKRSNLDTKNEEKNGEK